MNPVNQDVWNEGQTHAESATAGARRRITIDPVTRLEGHATIDVLLNASGEVDHAYLRVPELRGFETFAIGRPAEDMPQITSRICGVCPTAHAMAATKALDALYAVEPPPTARLIRELIYHAFIVEDHALHFYLLGGPDFIVGPDASPAARNVSGVLAKVGADVGRRVIAVRRRLRELIAYFGGKVIHPVFGLPGGVSKGLRREDLLAFQTAANDALDFARFTLSVFKHLVLQTPSYADLIRSETYTHRTYYMGLVDANDRVAFYDGTVRIVAADGSEYARFSAADYRTYIAEHVEPWSFMKFCYLKPLGWHGFEEGPQSGIYAVAPLARLNAAVGMATPLAQEAYEEYFATLGGKPVHHTLANHWARVIELLYAAERMVGLLRDPAITEPTIRRLPTAPPGRGIGIVEAPRGTLIHDYEADERGLITHANLIIATQNNAARIALSVDKAAKALIHDGVASEALLNRVEMAFRAYDPCFGCATHLLPGELPLRVDVYDAKLRRRQRLERHTASANPATFR